MTGQAHETEGSYRTLVVRRWAGCDVYSPRPCNGEVLRAPAMRLGGTNGVTRALSARMLGKKGGLILFQALMLDQRADALLGVDARLAS